MFSLSTLYFKLVRAHTFRSFCLQQLYLICSNFTLLVATIFYLQQLYFIGSHFFNLHLGPVATVRFARKDSSLLDQ